MEFFLKQLSEKKIKLSVINDDLQIEAPKGTVTPELLKEIKLNKEAILLNLRSSLAKKYYAGIPKTAISSSYPLAHSQKRFWISENLEAKANTHLISGAFLLKGILDAGRLENSFHVLVQRHEILRTIFLKDKDGNACQQVIPFNAANYQLEIADFSAAKDPLAASKNKIEGRVKDKFQLDQLPLIRIGLFRLAENEWHLYFSMHHIISDGWSMEILIRELIFGYRDIEAFSALPALHIQYKDFADWQLKYLASENGTQSREYWKKTFENGIPLFDLPSQYSRPAVQSNQGKIESRELQTDFVEKLVAYGRINQCSLFNVLFSGVSVLLYRYTAQKEFVLGTPVAGRNHVELENQIGPYLNLLPVKVAIDPEKSFSGILKEIKASTNITFEHQYYPFDLIVENLGIKKDLSRSPLFDVMVSLREDFTHQTKELNFEDELTITTMGITHDVSRLDIIFNFVKKADHLVLNIEYRTDLFEHSFILQLADHFITLLSGLIEKDHLPVSHINYVAPVKEQSPAIENIPVAALALLDAQKEISAEKIAVSQGEKQLTYHQLYQLADQFGTYLKEYGDVKKGDFVAISLPHSIPAIWSFLSVLRIGAVYVPVDPGYPASRIDYILQDCNSKFLINEHVIHQFLSTRATYLPGKPEEVEMNDLAYVIYTSGTTGNPKGVLLTHQNLSRHSQVILGHIKDFPDQIKMLNHASYSFDISVFEMLLPLLSGGELVIINRFDILAGENQMAILSKITHIQIIPSFLEQMISSVPDAERIKAFTAIRHIHIGGDAVQTLHLLNIKKYFEHAVIDELYGPTETTIWCTKKTYPVGPGDQQHLNGKIIGQPVAGYAVYILDDYLQIVPDWVCGELYIGGDGVASGYLNKEELTAKQFIPDPFEKGGRLYKTGDLVRRLKNGDLEFLGRKDEQVKIRGYRIELGEVEHAILSSPEVNDAVLVVKTSETGDKELVAYLVSDNQPDIYELRRHLLEILPRYMLPAHFVVLTELPLTPNGKVDKKALPDPASSTLPADEQNSDFVPARTVQERVLISVWEDVLKKNNIGIRDDFYNSGGDSIKSIQIVSRLKQKGYQLKIEHILGFPVLERMAGFMSQEQTIADQSVILGPVVMTPVQHYFFSQDLNNYQHYNQSVVLKSTQRLDTALLRKCMVELANHHDALRMVFRKQNNKWEQFNQDVYGDNFTVLYTDLRGNEDGVAEMGTVAEKLQAGFQLEIGPLITAGHFSLDDGDRVVLIIHHLVVDGMSWRILLEDLALLYSSYIKAENHVLPLKTDSFQRWAFLQQEMARSEQFGSEKDYWERVLNQFVMPFPKEIDTAQSPRIDRHVTFKLDRSITEILKSGVHHAYNTEINDILLSCLAIAIKKVFGIAKSMVKMEGHGREQILQDVDISRTVGWFTTMYPYVLAISGSAYAQDSLIKVKEDLRRIPNKGIGYGMLNYLRDDFHHPVHAAVLFNYLGDFDNTLPEDKDSALEFSSEYIGRNNMEDATDDILLSVSGMLVAGELTMSLGYASNTYHAQTIARLSASYKEALIGLIDHLTNTLHPKVTSWDLTFKDLSMEELAEINKDNNVADIYTLSPLQQGIYYHCLADQFSPMYFEQMSYRIKAPGLNIESVRKAYDKLVERHGVLRTGFRNDLREEPLQIVWKYAPSNFTSKEIPVGIPAAVFIEQEKLNDRELGFNLESSSQMRLLVIAHGNEDYEFIWSNHHIIIDGWCMGVLIKDFYQLLNAIDHNLPPDLPTPVPYSGYISWLNQIDGQKSRSYWENYLLGYTKIAEIPYRKTAIAQPAYKQAKQILKIEGNAYTQLQSFCNELGITQNTFIQGAWGYLLSRYNDVKDVVFGAVVSGRPASLPGVEDMVGLFINTIPVRVNYQDIETPAELLKTLNKEAIAGNQHHYINLSEIQSVSELKAQLINHIMIFENYPVAELLKEDLERQNENQELSIIAADVFEQTNYDLNVVVVPLENGLSIQFKYNNNIYLERGMLELTGHLESIITQFAGNPNSSLDEIELIAEDEKYQLIEQFNNTQKSFHQDKRITDLFEEQVKINPDGIALKTAGDDFTFSALDLLRQSYSAYFVHTLKIKKGDRMLISLAHDHHLVAVLLAVNRIGAVSVPVDPVTPAERIAFIYKDSNSAVLIDADTLALADLNNSADPVYNTLLTLSEDPEFIIYTSGSTGLPKGVLLTASGLMNRLNWMWEEYPFQKGEVCCAKTSISFVDHICELFGPLLKGIPLVLYQREELLDMKYFIDSLHTYKITRLLLVPSLLKAMLNYPALLKAQLQNVFLWFCSGEELKLQLVQQFYDTVQNENAHLINIYGSTEVTADATCYDTITYNNADTIVSSSGIVPIGKPIANSKIYILDQWLRLLPVGVPGEICISGAVVSSGYLHQGQGEDKFVRNPFEPSALLYKTGDLGKWMPDGNLVYSGRKDNQVKIRGHRVELAEIEYSILKNEQLTDAVVLAIQEQETDEIELAVYFTAKTEADLSEIKQFLKGALPDYMIPVYFFQVEEIPLNTNGKVDKRALAQLKNAEITGKTYVAPGNDTQIRLVKIWESVLKKDKISVTANFFELGGHSIKAMNILSKINKEFNLDMNIKNVFHYPVIEELSVFIDFIQKQKEVREKGAAFREIDL